MGQPKKHFVVPAWHVGMAKVGEEPGVNMTVKWIDVQVLNYTVYVPSLVNTRAVKEGELLLRPRVTEAPTPAPKRQRRS